MDEKKALELARSAYSSSTDYFDANIRTQAENDLRQFNGKHQSGSKYESDAYRARSKLFRPKTRAMIRKNEATAAAAYFSTQDVVAVSPVDDTDPVDVAASAFQQELLQYRLVHSIPWFLTCIGAYQDAQVVGAVFSKQTWEYDKRKGVDRPVIELRPIENIRIDAAADWADPIGTSPYLIDMRPMYLKDVRAMMEHEDAEKRWLPLTDSEISASVASYGDSTRLVRDAPKQDAKAQSIAINDFTVVWVHENYMQYGGEEWVYFTLGAEKLLSAPKYLDEVHHHGKRPYVMGTCMIETHRVYKSSLPKLSRDVQVEINEVANQRLDNVKFVLNKRYFVKRGRQVDLRSLTRNVPSSVTLMQEPNEDVKIVDTPDVTGSSYQEHDRLNLDFDDLTGVFSQNSVQSNRNLNETVGGMDKLESNANQVGEYQLRVFTETWVEPVLMQLMALEREYETDERVIRLSMSSAQEKAADIGDYSVEDLLARDVNLNVNVGIGATNPQTQLERFVYGVDAAIKWFGQSITQNFKSDEILAELFGKLGYRDGKRFFSFEDEDPNIAMLKQQIQALQQAIDAKHPPELLDAMVRKLDAEVKRIENEAVNKSVESIYSATQAASNVAQAPQLAPMADAMLKSGGFVDRDADPIIPQDMMPVVVPELDMPDNTNPMTPANPAVGMDEGIETMELGDA